MFHHSIERNLAILLGSFLLLLLHFPSYAQEEAPKKSMFQSIQELPEELPVINIKSDWKKLIRTKLKEEYQEATFSFTNAEGKEVLLPAKIRSRGNIRKEVCYYPPIKVKFKKKKLAAMGYDTLNKLKLVVQCRKGSIGESYLFKESFLYDLYEEIGPISYLTKPIKLNLINADGKVEPLYAFLIEEEDEFSKRLEAKVFEVGRVRSKLIDRDAYLKMVFFQYLILNTDWNVSNKHNIEFIWLSDVGKCVMVPYDFDYAGLVGTSYAVPHPSLGISSVQEACFRGKDVTEIEAKAMAKYFLSQEEKIYQLLKDYPHFDKGQRRIIASRLDEFFDLLKSKKGVQRNFVNGK